MSIAIDALEKIRRQLLDLTNRNNLLNYRLTAKSIQIIDELPDTIYHQLLEGKSLELLPVPEPADEPDQDVLEKALRRHVIYRTATALERWRDLNSVGQATPLLENNA